MRSGQSFELESQQLNASTTPALNSSFHQAAAHWTQVAGDGLASKVIPVCAVLGVIVCTVAHPVLGLVGVICVIAQCDRCDTRNKYMNCLRFAIPPTPCM